MAIPLFGAILKGATTLLPKVTGAMGGGASASASGSSGGMLGGLLGGGSGGGLFDMIKKYSPAYKLLGGGKSQEQQVQQPPYAQNGNPPQSGGFMVWVNQNPIPSLLGAGVLALLVYKLMDKGDTRRRR